MNENIAAAEILESAAFVVGTGHHTKGGYARGSDGKQTAPDDNAACAWCLIGAIYVASSALYPGVLQLRRLAVDATRKTIKRKNLARYNDAAKRTPEEVEAALLKAATVLRGEA
jgi:hypothetical protein